MNSKNTGGVGFLGLLTLLFIGLKLTGHIAWSWIWVLAPLWIPLSLVLCFFVCGIIFISIVDILNVLNKNKNIKR